MDAFSPRAKRTAPVALTVSIALPLRNRNCSRISESCAARTKIQERDLARMRELQATLEQARNLVHTSIGDAERSELQLRCDDVRIHRIGQKSAFDLSKREIHRHARFCTQRTAQCVCEHCSRDEPLVAIRTIGTHLRQVDACHTK